jgi:hypothetical protein
MDARVYRVDTEASNDPGSGMEIMMKRCCTKVGKKLRAFYSGLSLPHAIIDNIII